MRNFLQIGTTDVLHLRLELERHPELWDGHAERTDHEGSPHAGLSDIWLRYRAREALVSPASFNEPFAEMEWYPAIAALPAARFILMEIMGRMRGVALGGCIITKIPSCRAVLPHSDAESWHARYFSTKVYVPIAANPNCVNWCDGESFVPKVGEVFSFDNRKMHSVVNDGADDRMTLMCAIRCD